MKKPPPTTTAPAAVTLTRQSDLDHLADLSFHFIRSGDRLRGVKYACQAADQAMQQYAFEYAFQHYRVALEQSAATDEARGDLLMRTGLAAMLGAEERQAGWFYAEAEKWFEGNDQLALANQALYNLGLVYLRMDRLNEARTALGNALQNAQTDELRVAILIELAGLLAVSLGKFEEALPYAREALKLTTLTSNLSWRKPAALRNLGNLLVRSHSLPAGIEMLEQALELSKEARDVAEAAECCACLSIAYAWTGAMRRFEGILRERVKFAINVVRRGLSPSGDRGSLTPFSR